MRRMRMVAAAGVLVVALGACDGDTPEVSDGEEVADATGDEEDAGDDADEPQSDDDVAAEEDPPAEEEPEPETAPAVDTLAVPDEFTPFEAFRSGELGGDLAFAVSATDAEAAQSGDVSEDTEAFVAAGLSAESKVAYSRPASEDRDDQIILTQGEFGDPAAAAAEFERIRTRATQEADEYVAGTETTFGWRNPVMVQIDPNTGNAVGPTGLSRSTAVLVGSTITTVELYFGDETTEDPAIMADLVAQVQGS